MKQNLKIGLCAFVLLAGINQAAAQGTQFLRIAGPTVTTITAFNPDGTIVWSNAQPGANRLRTALFQSGLEPGCCLAPACSCPAHRRAPPLLAHCLAVRPLPTANAIGVKPKLPEKCHNYLVDDFGPAW
jgi:hypothetical protein